MKPENHKIAYEEHKRNIFVWALEINGIEQSQRTIGLNASRGIVELLNLFLEEQKKVTLGFQINHRWFKSNNVFNRLPEFSEKEAVVNKMIELENLSEALSYGTPKSREEISKVVALFKDLEKIINKLRGVDDE